jgi:hypothetical protein
MSTESEEELQRSAVAYIRRHSMHTGQWKFTRLGELHVQLCEQFATEPEEKVIVSSFRSPESWYIFTTRRLVSMHAGVFSEMEAIQTVGKDFGNFKGYVPNGPPGTIPTEIGTVEHAESGATLQLEFETLYASMAIIYACKFWERRARRLHRTAEIAQSTNAKADA